MNCSSFVHGILQARILQWVAVFSSKESSQPGITPGSTLNTVGVSKLYFVLPGFELGMAGDLFTILTTFVLNLMSHPVH